MNLKLIFTPWLVIRELERDITKLDQALDAKERAYDALARRKSEREVEIGRLNEVIDSLTPKRGEHGRWASKKVAA